MSRAWMLVTALGLAACGGGDVDLTGVYRVDTAVGSDQGCAADAPLADASPFLRFHKESFIGAKYFAIDSCNDEAATDCPGTGSIFGGLFEPFDGGWRGVVTTSSGGTTCALGYDETVATLDGAMLVLEHTFYTDQVQVASESACTTDEAEKRGDAMPCARHSIIDATRASP